MDPHVAQNPITPPHTHTPLPPPTNPGPLPRLYIYILYDGNQWKRLIAVVQQSASHPGNNLVANWLEDGENWKLKLEILIINRGKGGKKGQEMPCGNEIGPPGKWGFLFVMKCMWHAFPMLQGYQSGAEEEGEKKISEQFKAAENSLMLLEICIVPLWGCFFSPFCVTFLDSLICHAPDM